MVDSSICFCRRLKNVLHRFAVHHIFCLIFDAKSLSNVLIECYVCTFFIQTPFRVFVFYHLASQYTNEVSYRKRLLCT